MTQRDSQITSRSPRTSLYKEAVGVSIVLRFLLVIVGAIRLWPIEGSEAAAAWVLGGVALYGLLLAGLQRSNNHPALVLVVLVDLAATIGLLWILSPPMARAIPVFAYLGLVLTLGYGWPGAAVSLAGYLLGESVALLSSDFLQLDAWSSVLRVGSMIVGAIVLGLFVEQHESLRTRVARVALTKRALGVFDLQNFAKALDFLHKLAVRGKWNYSVMVLDVAKAGDHSGGRRRPLSDDEERLLEAVGDEARSALRSTDLIGRVGEDVFGIALPETDLSGAKLVAHRLRERLREIDSELEVTVGFAGINPTRTDAAEDCLHSAFADLRRAKQGDAASA